MNAIDREKLLAWLDDELSREQHIGKAHAIMKVMAKVRSGVFDIKPPKAQWRNSKTVGSKYRKQTGESKGRQAMSDWGKRIAEIRESLEGDTGIVMR